MKRHTICRRIALGGCSGSRIALHFRQFAPLNVRTLKQTADCYDRSDGTIVAIFSDGMPVLRLTAAWPKLLHDAHAAVARLR